MKTVYIVGAGANAEIGMPTGEKLKEIIIGLLDIQLLNGQVTSGSKIIYSAIVKYSNDNNIPVSDMLNGCRSIAGALPLAISIDNYLDAHRDNKIINICGKMAIITAILSAESSSNFTRPDRLSNLHYGKISQTWFSQFFKLCTENCQKENLVKRFSEFTFIIFNYDRCFEYFLFNALLDYYKLGYSEIIEIIEALKIFHPYGEVGTLDFLVKKTKDVVVPFGHLPSTDELINLTGSLLTFTESRNISKEKMTCINTSLRKASRLVFLGFAYHKLNMGLLFPKKIISQSSMLSGIVPQVIGTIYKVSKENESEIERMFLDIFNASIEITLLKATSYDLLCNLSFVLSCTDWENKDN